MTNSREKGKRGEREFAAFLRSIGFDARRTQQYAGDAGTADVDSSIEGMHWEVKRRSGIASLRFMEQARRDSLESLPVVAMREDRGEWHLLIEAKDLERFARTIVAALDGLKITSDTSSTSPSDGGRLEGS